MGLTGGSVSGGRVRRRLVRWNSKTGSLGNSYNTGVVLGALDSTGGLVGSNDGSIGNSHATGNVTGGQWGAGGLVGGNNSTGVISGSYSTGNVIGAGSSGGFAGWNTGTITTSYATGNSTTSGCCGWFGGLVGDNVGNISDSYATGNSVANDRVGGLVGNHHGGTITNSYSTGTATAWWGASYAGGLTGGNPTGTGTVINSYWNVTTSGLAASGNAGDTGLTTAQMKAMANFTGWNIAGTGGAGATWRIYEGNTAPLLTGFLKPLTVTADPVNTIYNGNAYAGALVNPVYNPASPNFAQVLGSANAYGNATNAGTYAPALYSVQQGYDISYLGATLTINPAGLVVLNVTASDATKTYGTTLTFNGTEFTPVGLLGGDTISGVTLTSAGAVNTANAGSYAIIPGNAVFSAGSASNYNISYVNGTLTVNALPMSIAASASSKVYGDPDSSSFIATGLMPWDTYAATFTGALSHTGGENVGTYTITQGTLAANANYTVTGFTGNTLTITPAPLSVYAYPTNKIISTPDPLLGYMVSGLKLGDTAAATLNTGSLARDAGEAVGNYQINQGSLALASSNYTMTYYPASFTILAPTVVDEIANAILLLGTPDTGSAQSTSSSEEDEKRKAEEAAAAAATPAASADASTQALPVCP